MNSLLKISLLICLWVFTMPLQAQTLLKGAIKGKEDRAPVSFATVYLQKNAYGTTTGQDGRYTLNLPSANALRDTLVVRCVGYKEKRIPVMISERPQVIHIVLEPDVTLLDEIVITSSSRSEEAALDILKKVRKSIKKNYITDEIVRKGFYREVLLENGVAIKLNEADVQLRQTSYPSPKLSRKTFNDYWDDFHQSSKYKLSPFLSYFAQHWPVFTDQADQAEILASRVSLNSGTADGSIKNLGDPLGGPIDLVGMDNLKYQLHFFNKKLQDKYIFSLLENQVKEKRASSYVIRFRPVQPPNCYFHKWTNKVSYPVFEGFIYIDKADYSVDSVTSTSVNWPDVTASCQKEHSKNRSWQVPATITYTVTYENTTSGKALKTVNYASHHRTDQGVYSWERTLVLENTPCTPLNLPDERQFPVISESLRYRTSKYDSAYWNTLEGSERYVALKPKYRNDLEKEIPLSEQFLLRNLDIRTIPLPPDPGEKYTTNRDSLLQDLGNYNTYSSAVLQKLVDYEKRFIAQCSRVLEDREVTDIPDLSTYKLEPDSLYQYIYYERLPDSTYKPVFNLTRESKLDPSRQISRVSFTGDKVILTKKAVGSFHKTLLVKTKGSNHTQDSLARVADYHTLSNHFLLYTTVSATGRSHELRLRELRNNKKDTLLLAEPDVNYEIELNGSTSGKYVMVTSSSKDQSRHFVFDRSSQRIFPLLPAEVPGRSTADHFAESGFFMVIGGTQLYKLRKEGDSFRKTLLYSSKSTIDDFFIARDQAVITEYSLFNTALTVVDLSGGQVNPVKIKKGFNSIQLVKPKNTGQLPDIILESKIQPPLTYRLDLSDRQLQLTEEEKFSFAASKSNFVSELSYATGEDGTQIPMLISYDRKAIKDSVTAVLLEVYGAYGAPDYPVFKPEDIALMQNGFVHVRAGVRGSGVLGSDWYLAGKKRSKNNTFRDFRACVQEIRTQYNLDKSKVFARGVSAGGLVMGYMANNFSGDFGGLIMDRPFLDVYRTMQDSSGYLTTLEYTEWGNPAIAEDKANILSYSPLQNIPERISCNLFVRASFYDYITPVTQVARGVFSYARSMEKDKLLLFKTDLNQGHTINFNYKRLAEEYAFMRYCAEAK